MTRKSELSKALTSLTPKELVSLIVELCEEDKLLGDRLMVRFSKGDSAHELNQCEKLIASIVNKYTGRRGIVPLEQATNFVRELMDLLEKADETEDVLLALTISFMVLEEAMQAYEYADDSEGDIGWLASESMDQIRAVVERKEELDESQQAQMLDKLLEQSDSPVFFDWKEYRDELLAICSVFADNEIFRAKLEAKLQQ